MKPINVFEIYNMDTKETFYVQNKERFCTENNLTRRLLDKTRSGERTHHKRYVLRQGKFQFIESSDGDKKLYGSDIIGYVVSVANKYEEKNKSELEIVEGELAIAYKKIQKLQDKLRISNKINREQNRQMSITDDFIDSVVEILDRKSLKRDFKIVEKINEDKTLLVQLSDLHFGKVVNLPHNKFNLEIARERLIKYAGKILYYAQTHKINNAIICWTGDMTTLDSHRDNLLTNESNRADNFVSALDIMSEFLDIISSELNVRCVGVVGNESRLVSSEYQSNNDRIASNNFDTLLFKVLKRTHKHIDWIGECDKLNDVIKVQNKNILLTHGDKFKHTKDEVLKLKYRIVEQIGEKIDYAIFGHIHSTLITPTYSRCGSIVGSDEYAFNGLNISESVASQNIYIVDNNITAIEIKL